MKNFKKERLLVIAPHPDDEVIGCGGLINRVKDEGGKVFVLFLTVGTTKDYKKGSRGQTEGRERIGEIREVAKFFKFDDYEIAFAGDNYHLRLDSLPQKDLIEAIENGRVSLNKVKPTIVAMPAPDSYNQDHRVAAQATFAATRPMPKEFKHPVNTVLSYEEPQDIWHPNEAPRPNFFVDLDPKHLLSKTKALKIYKSQLRDGSHPRSPQTIEALAKARGAQAGVLLSEAFYCYRQLY